MTEKRKQDRGYRIAVAGFQGVIRILIYILAAVILILLGKRAYTIGYQVVSTKSVADAGSAGETVSVRITDEMSVLEIGKLLREQGLIDEEPVSFVIQEMLSEYRNKILPGTYELNNSMTVDEMLRILSQTEDSSDSESGE